MQETMVASSLLRLRRLSVFVFCNVPVALTWIKLVICERVRFGFSNRLKFFHLILRGHGFSTAMSANNFWTEPCVWNEKRWTRREAREANEQTKRNGLNEYITIFEVGLGSLNSSCVFCSYAPSTMALQRIEQSIRVDGDDSNNYNNV